MLYHSTTTADNAGFCGIRLRNEILLFWHRVSLTDMASYQNGEQSIQNNEVRIVTLDHSNNAYERPPEPENVNDVHTYETLPEKRSQINHRVRWVIEGVVVLIAISVSIGVTVHCLTRKPQPTNQTTTGKSRDFQGREILFYQVFG